MKMMKNSFVKLFVVFTVILVWLLEGTFLNYPYKVMGASEQTVSSSDTKNNTMDDITSQVVSGEKTYMEKDISLPKLAPYEYLQDMLCNSKGQCEVFTVTHENSGGDITGYNRYTLINGSWNKSEIKWDNAFGSPVYIYPSTPLKYASDGNLYCITSKNKDFNSQQQLVKISDEGKVDVLDIPALAVKTNNSYPRIQSYDITTNNQFVFSDGATGSIRSYDLMTGKLLFLKKNCLTFQLVAINNTISYIDNSTGILNTIDTTTGRKLQHHPLLKNDSINSLSFLNNNERDFLWNTKICSDGKNVSVANKNGIYTFKSDKPIYYVNSYSNELSRPSNQLKSFCLDRTDSFYTFTQEADYSYSIKYYSPENNSETNYKSSLTIAISKDDERVTETICLFSQKHPEIKINVIHFNDKDSAASQKNELEKADIIVFGSNSYSTIKSTGLLEDLYSTTQSLVESEGLYQNIISAFYEGDGQYALPTEFTPYVFAGDKSLLMATNSLDSLQTYAKENGTVWQGLGYETLGNVNYQFFYPMIIDKNGSWNKTALKQLLGSFHKTSKIYLPDEWSGEDDWYNNICYSRYINNKKSLLATEINEPDDLMYLLAAINKAGGIYQCSGSFEVGSLVSINKSANLTLTKEFLSIMYSDKVQNNNIGNGLPMKIACLDAWSEIQFPNRYIFDANYKIALKPVLLQSNDVNKFKDMLVKLTKNIPYDYNQASSMAQSMEQYLTGNRNITDTINEIEKSNSQTKSSYQSLSLKSSKEINILFIGNSLTRVGEIPSQFRKIAGLNGKKVKVRTMLNNGYYLYNHLSNISKLDKYKDLLKEADVVILQEYGGYTDTTVSDILKIMKMASPNTKFLYYLPDYDTDNDLDKERRLSQIKNLTIIPAGHIIDQLTSDYYEYENLHQPGDYHPNLLNGFISSEAVYVSLFGKDLKKVTYNSLSNTLKPLLINSNVKDKQTELNMLKDYVLKQY